ENGNNAEGRSYAPRQGGFNKPNYTKDGQRSYNKPNRDGASSDRPRSNYGDRPNRSEGGNSEGRSYAPREGGFKKPFNKDGAKRSEGGFKKPFSKDGAKRSNGPRDGAEKRISQKRPAAR